MSNPWAAIIIAMWISGGLSTVFTKDRNCLGLSVLGTILTGAAWLVVQIVGKLLS
jgi:hypothetical protein